MAQSCLIGFRIAGSLVLIGLVSCKGQLPDKPEADVIADSIVDVGIVADTELPVDVPVDAATTQDAPASDAETPDAEAPDGMVPDTPTGACPGGEGCSCTGNDTCDNGICLDTHEGKRCATTCVDSCDPGYSCQQYGSVDGAFFCVSSQLSLCAPCQTHADCQIDGIAALCLSYGAEGSFCGAPCKVDSDCPGGYECKASDDGKGGQAKQCRRQPGKICGCSDWAKDKAAKTTCTVSNEIGTCTASRKCAADGLEACAAQPAAAEVCNGQDDDCDGATDVLAVGAKCYVEAFSGGGSATVCKTDADCTVEGEACDESVGKCDLLIGACPGEALCVNGKEVCLKAKTPEVESCNNKDDDCDGQTDEAFAVTLPDGATASVGAACGLGACAGGMVECVGFNKAACSTDGDKAGTESCNGKDDDCDGQTDESACDDGDACTTDVCDSAKAACSHTAAVDCDDGEGCTKDVCDAKTGGCGHDGASVAGQDCDDGDSCTVDDACAAGKCAPGKDKGCDDGNPCTDDGCDNKIGCVNQANIGGCSDGDACTDGDGCKGGTCVSGAAVKCDDGEVCTDDACDAAKGCVVTANAGSCSDGDACTDGDGCTGGTCVPGAAVKCDDGEVCTADTCDKAAGCVHSPAQASCTDGDACTKGDSCKVGKCAAGSAVKCDDGEVCTQDACDAAKGCVATANAVSCSDGDACTEGDGCKAGKCAAGSTVKCDDGEDCTADTCSKAAGCVHLPTQASCTDGDACTAGDTCKSGKCVAGLPKDCNDGESCTVDGCDKAAGCTHLPAKAACTDGNVCTDGDACTGTKCVPGKALNCDDGNVCTEDVCDKVVGCTFKANSLPCADGNACTAPDQCKESACKAGASKDCNDNNASTLDTCDIKTGCQHGITSVVAGCKASGGVMEAGKYCTKADGKAAWGMVPAGTFWMGCNPTLDKECANITAENPQHKVTISKPFWLGLTEVTVAQYRECVKVGQCKAPSATDFYCGGITYTQWNNWAMAKRDAHPVNCLDWSQAKGYCKWAGGYLPTEAEWELAARGRCEDNGSSAVSADCVEKMRVYPWGDSPPKCGDNSVFQTGKSWDAGGCSNNHTWPVGTGSASGRGPFGHYDMAGNVGEWVRDWLSSSYYKSSPQYDPESTDAATYRVVRGGHFRDQSPVYGLRSSRRGADSPPNGSSINGFRCAKHF